MNIVWFSWKDINHPEAGGAERVSDQLRVRLAKDGHSVTLITASYKNEREDEIVDGVHVLRAGNRYSVYIKARKLYKNLPPQDLVVDEMNTIPFMASFYRGPAKAILLTYQLARSVWFHQMSFPLSFIGYVLEPIYLRLISSRYSLVLTESESTKTDLSKHGFKLDNIEVFRVGMDAEKIKSLDIPKTAGSIIFLGALRPMKQPIDAIKAFELARDTDPELTFTMIGNDTGTYAEKVTAYANDSRHAKAIHMLGRVNETEKTKLLRSAELILVTSVKEGWGLIVTEANSQGTPAVVYDTDGLRDSVQANKTGYVVPSGNSQAMADAILELLQDKQAYKLLRLNAFEHSKQFTYKNSYTDFCNAIDKVI